MLVHTRVKNFLKLVEEEKITSQNQCAKLYNEKYNENIAQSTVQRYFKKLNIVIDYSKGRYVCKPEDKTKETEPFICNLLRNSSYGSYGHKKEIKGFWLNVDPGTETIIANEIYKFCDGRVTLLPGYGCIFIRCIDSEINDKLKQHIKDYKIVNESKSDDEE